MKQNLLNTLWLRVGMIVAIMTTALSGTVWAETATWAGTTALPGTATSIGNSPITIMVSATNTYSNPIRLYANTTVTITATTGYVIQSVAYEASSTGNYVTYAQNATVTPNVTPTVSGKIVTWALSNASEFTFTPSAQTRANGITVTYTSAGGTPTVATPVINGTENFLTSTEVSISCATDGATILYNTGGDAWETYSAPFTVTETTTVKAKATKTSMDDSEVATKTFTKVTALTVAQARAAIDAGVGVEGVYATGIVSAIPTAYNASYKNITFNFVDAAGDEVFLQAYRCGGDEAADVQVGDVVVVYGNLTKYGTTYEFAQGCELISLTHPTVTVEAPIFSPDGGVFTTPQSVSFAVAAPTMEGYTFYYTLDGTEPTTESTLYTGPIEVSTTTTIKAIAVKGGEVSLVTTATYAILAHAGTEADPYSVADAHAAIDANAGLTDVYATGVVTEIVTAWSTDHSNITFNFDDAAGDGGSFLQAYRCVSTDAADASTVAVGDIVVVKGTLKKYNDIYEFGQGCELISLTHSATPADPVIVAENATIAADVTYYELMYSIENPVDGTELTASATASWITSCTPSQKSFDRVMIECEANESTEARTATITLIYGTATKEVTLTQEGAVAPVEDYVTLPYKWKGGTKEALLAETGVTAFGLGSNYAESNSPYLIKFDGDGDYIQVKTDSRPGVVEMAVKMIGGNKASTITVQESADGETFADLEELTISGNQNNVIALETTEEFASDTRYIRFLFTKGSNVGVGPFSIAKYGEVTPEYTLAIANPENVTITASYGGETVLQNGEEAEVAKGTEVTVALSIAEGYVLQSLTIAGEEEGQTVTPIEADGVWTFSMPAYNVIVTATVVEYVAPATGDQYALFTGSIEEGDYIVIYNGNAMSTTVRNGRLQNVEVTPVNDVITTSDASIVWHIAEEPDYGCWTLYNAEAEAYAASTGVRNKAQMLEFEGVYDDDDKMALWQVIGDGTDGYEFANHYNENADLDAFWLRNNGSYGFACYTVSIGGPLSLYKKVETPAPTAQTVTVSDAGYATIVAEANLLVPADVDGAFTAKIMGNYVTLTSVDAIPEGAAVIVKAEAGTYDFAYTNDDVEELTANDLVGAEEDVEADGSQYVLANGANGIGFYQVTTGTVIPAGKAYLVVPEVMVDAKAFYGFEDDATAIEMVDGQTSMVNGPVFNLAGQRMSKMQKGINLVGGKKILR